MRKVVSKEEMALLNAAGEMCNETGCVPGVDGEQVPAERLVPGAKDTSWRRLRRGSNLRPGDMGYAWIYAGAFLANAKMAAKMQEARESPRCPP